VQFDIPDLIKKVKAAKYKIGVFPAKAAIQATNKKQSLMEKYQQIR